MSGLTNLPSYVLLLPSFFEQDRYILIAFLPPISTLLNSGLHTHLASLSPQVRRQNTCVSVQSLRRCLIRTNIGNMIPGKVVAGAPLPLRLKPAITKTHIDTADISHPSHNTPTFTARTRKATIQRIPPTSIFTTRFLSPKRRPVLNERTHDCPCLHPCLLHRSSSRCP